MQHSASDEKKLIGKKVIWIKDDVGNGINKGTEGEITDAEWDDSLNRMDYQVRPGNDFKVWYNDDKTFVKILNEENNMSRAQEYLKSKGLLNEDSTPISAVDFMAKIDSTIKSIFPDSYIVVNSRALGGDSIMIKFALGKDRSEWENEIIENDPIYNIYWMHDSIDKTTGNMKPTFAIESNMTSISLKNFAGRIKTGWMKKTGTPEKILEHIKKHFTKIKDLAKQNKDKLEPIIQHKL
jgi:hypothetical protein